MDNNDLKLDKLDKKILFELDKNSRQSFSEIAKSTGTSPQVVKYRIENLYKTGILLYSWPMIEYRSVGYFFGLYFIKLQNMNEKNFTDLSNYLNNQGYIPIIMWGEGYADLIIAICAKGIFHLSQIATEINSKFSHLILEYESVIPIGFSRFYRNYLIGEKELTPNVAFTGADKKEIQLDLEDRKILSMLNFNSRTPTIEIARKIKMSKDTIQNRIKKLNSLGIIQCNTILLDHVKTGYPRHRVLLKLKNLNEKLEKKLFTYCNLHPNIVHHLKVLGNWDLVIDIEVETREKFRQIINEIKFEFSEIVHRIEPTYVYKIDQFRDIPIEYPELNYPFV